MNSQIHYSLRYKDNIEKKNLFKTIKIENVTL